MEEKILVFDGSSRILIGDRIYTMKDKFEVPGVEFDYLYYETLSGNYFKVTDGKQIFLTEEEIASCDAFIADFLETQDYLVYAYDPERDCIYKGEMNKSVAEGVGWKWVLDAPEGFAFKYKDDKWVKVVLVIREDGSWQVNPDGFCDLCVLFFDQDEYSEAGRTPLRNTDKWDFTKEEFYDARDPEDYRKKANLAVRNKFEEKRQEAYGEFIPPYERDTWGEQLREARGWLSDETFETPYADAFLAARTDENVPTKREFLEDVAANNSKFLEAMARCAAQEWEWLGKVKGASTCDEYQAIIDSVEAL